MTAEGGVPGRWVAPGCYLVAATEVPAERSGSDPVSVRTTIGRVTGCERLVQREVRCGPGRSAPRGPAPDAEEVLFVAAGRGNLVTGERLVGLEPEVGVHLPPGSRYVLDNPGPGELVLVAVSVPAAPSGALPAGGSPAGPDADPRRPTGAVRAVAAASRPVERTGDREFRRMIDPSTGCAAVTQFVGVIPPGRAPAHSHTYDEVVYVLDGAGVLHAGDGHRPIAAGSCMHLAPPVPHCLENTGSVPLRVLGVFHPAGSPAAKHVTQGFQSAEVRVAPATSAGKVGA